jgi:hypothetical protein
VYPSWIAHFLGCEEYKKPLRRSFADVSDPFGVGKETILVSEGRDHYPVGENPGISRETFLTAFLA